jgi:hypothetical protein
MQAQAIPKRTHTVEIKLASVTRMDRSPVRKSRPLVWLAAASVMIVCPRLYAMQVELTTAVEGEFRPAIKVSCNLPDGVKFVVRVTRKESAFESETPVEVQSGRFAVGPLLQGSGDLNPGVYNLEIVSVHPTDQPDAVRAAIGQKGEELRGPLTKRYAGATFVRLLTTFQIGRAANPELDQARRQQVKLSQTRWWRKNCADICSGGERYSQQKGEVFDRETCMKTCISNPPSVSR